MWYLSLILSFFTLVSPGPKLKKVKITDRITVSLPADFNPVTDEDMMNKAISSQRPTAMYTNSERMVDFSVNITKNSWPDDNLILMKDFYKASLYTMYSEVEMLKEEVREVKKRKVLSLAFISTVKPEAEAFNQKSVVNYTYVQYALVDGRVIVCNFTCPVAIYTQWQETAEAIMNTVKIK